VIMEVLKGWEIVGGRGRKGSAIASLAGGGSAEGGISPSQLQRFNDLRGVRF